MIGQSAHTAIALSLPPLYNAASSGERLGWEKVDAIDLQLGAATRYGRSACLYPLIPSRGLAGTTHCKYAYQSNPTHPLSLSSISLISPSPKHTPLPSPQPHTFQPFQNTLCALAAILARLTVRFEDLLKQRLSGWMRGAEGAFEDVEIDGFVFVGDGGAG